MAGQSLEAQAREARYQALTEMAIEQGVAVVLVAQHADDQVETQLLALSRGAGLAGLAGMSGQWEQVGAGGQRVRFERPWLNEVHGADTRAWLSDRGHAWIEDPSNADAARTRNRFRRWLLPALDQAMAPRTRAQWTRTWARSARHAHEALELLETLGQEDLLGVGRPPRIKSLQGLSQARQMNALRVWLKQDHGVIGSEAQMRELLRVLSACVTRGHQVDIRVGPGTVRRNGKGGEALCWVADFL